MTEKLSEEQLHLQAATVTPKKVEVSINQNRYRNYSLATGRAARVISSVVPERIETITISFMNPNNTEINNISINRKEFEKAVQRNPESIEALFRAATIYFVNRDMDKAELAYRRALTLNSNVPEAHFNLAMIYRQRGLLNRAFFELRTVLRLNPKYSEAHFNIAGIYLLKNKFDLAQYHYFHAANLGYPVDQTIFKKIKDLRNGLSANSDAG